MGPVPGSYEHGKQFGDLNALLYGPNHAARYDYPHDTVFCRGYHDGYEEHVSQLEKRMDKKKPGRKAKKHG